MLLLKQNRRAIWSLGWLDEPRVQQLLKLSPQLLQLRQCHPIWPQRGRKEDSKEPESLHSEEEGDQSSLLQRGKENTYLSRSASSFEVGPTLRLSSKKPPKQRKPPQEVYSISKYYHQGTKENFLTSRQNKEIWLKRSHTLKLSKSLYFPHPCAP